MAQGVQGAGQGGAAAGAGGAAGADQQTQEMQKGYADLFKGILDQIMSGAKNEINSG